MKCFLVHNDGLAVVAGGLCGFLPGTPATAESVTLPECGVT